MFAILSGTSNWRYNAAYFGKAMRGHMAQIAKEGLAVSSDVKTAVDQAEACLKEHCDGKDCSFVITPLG
jgi:hypothetical protein